MNRIATRGRASRCRWTLGLGLVFFLLPGGARAQDAPTQLASAVSVHYLDEKGAILAKTDGTLIREGLLLPFSALAGAAKVEVIGRSGQHWTTTGVLSLKPDVDLALMSLDPAPSAAASVLRASGYLPGGDVKVYRGPDSGSDDPIAAKTPGKFSLRGPDFIALTAGGSQGGPVFRPSGDFVGIARGFDEPPYVTDYIVTAASVIRLLEGAHAASPLDQIAPPAPPIFADRSSVQGLVFRGALLVNTGKLEDARSFLTLAVKLERQNPDALFWWGQIFLREESYLEAASRFREAAEAAGNFQFAWHMAGAAMNQAKRYDQAIEMYKKALEVDPNSAMTHCNLGGAYYNLNQFENAVAEFDKSRQLDGKYWLAYANLASTYKRMGQMLKAEEIYQELLVKNPNAAGQLRKDLDTQE